MNASVLPAGAEPFAGAAARAGFPVVGIGASDGAVGALTRLFAHIPAHPEMAFIVIVHLPPDHQSSLAAILGQATPMPVRQVLESVAIERDHVYVIAPKLQLEMDGGWLRVAPPESGAGPPAAVDMFFRTLGDAQRERAVGVVLSGMGSDGALGLRRIKAQGGVTFAQARADAEFDSMPAHAIGAGAVDFELPAHAIGPKLVQVWAHAQRIALPLAADHALPLEAPPTPASAAASEQALGAIIRLLRERTGHDFRHYKAATVLRRLERRLQVTGMPDLPEYSRFLQAHVEETAALLEDLLIGVTNFFRDRDAFEALAAALDQTVFAPTASQVRVRAWIAGCATGEEAFSVAMLLSERAAARQPPPDVQVFGSDIDECALATAHAGLYPDTIAADVEPTRLRRFFQREQSQLRVHHALREKVLFATHDLLRDPPFSDLDLVCCRNLLIYLDRSVQARLLQVFHFALRPGGLLFLGASESVDSMEGRFEPIDRKHRIYRAAPTPRARRTLPALPWNVRLSVPPPSTAPPTGAPGAAATLHAATSAARGSRKDPTVAMLEDELKRTREELRGSLDDSAVSSAELRASNEELRSINEKLRSTTEALETSKEELQSVNQELVTVNQALKIKVEEASIANDDLTNLIDSTEIATIFVDRGMRIKRFTPKASQLFNLIPADLGRSLLHITQRLNHASLEADAIEAFQTLRAVEREVRGPDDTTYLARVLPYRTRRNAIDGAVLTFIDISSTRRAEERLRLGEANLRLLVESTKDFAIITLDTGGIVMSWNEGARRMFGFEERDIVGQPIDLVFMPRDRADGAPQRERQTARDEGRAADERWQLRKDGSSFFCSGIMTPMYEHGRLVGYAKIARDLTDNKRAEIQLGALLEKETEVRAELQRAIAMKDEFLAVMSHELKHPLNLIHVNAELLARLPEARSAPAVARAADVIRRAVLSQAKITDDLLDLSRLRTGKLTVSAERVQWSAAVMRVVEAIAEDARAKRLTVEVDTGPPELTVQADPVRVEQVVWNLTSNALKFTQPGGRIELRLSREGGEGRLDVVDDGQGIAPDFLGHVFEMFRQADRSTTRSHAGMGIGLALVKHLVEEQGGRVAVASAGIGRGARFSVWLPLASAAGALPFADAAPAALRGLRVLLVDDTADALESFAALLRLEGADVSAVLSAPDALAAIETERFDVLLSDVAMPGMDGYGLIARWRAHPRTAATPAIALTGFGRAQDVQRALEAGFDAHLAKPVAIEQLLDALRLLPGSKAPAPDADL